MPNCLVKDTPSIKDQVPWPVGFFNFGKAEFPNVNYFNCGLVHRPDGEWLVTRRAIFDRNVRVGRNDVVCFKLEDRLPQFGRKAQFTKTFEGEHYEDPRAIYHNGQTYISVCDFVWGAGGWSGAHQIIESFNRDWQSTGRYDPVYGKNGSAIGNNSGHEKNWIWFFHDGEPHMIYGARPHEVARFSFDFRHKQTYISENKHPWKWGEIRGGTPPVLVDGEYWTFFHSSTQWQPPFKQYHMGAYAFEANSPFKITTMTRRPILSGSRHDRWAKNKPIVTFPCGSHYKDGRWFIVGGCNDLCCFWADMPHEYLLEMSARRHSSRVFERIMA